MKQQFKGSERMGGRYERWSRSQGRGRREEDGTGARGD